MVSPYRIKDEVAAGERKATTLAYPAGERETVPARGAVQIGIVGMTAGLAASAFGFPQVGVAILVGAAAVGVWRWRKPSPQGGLLLAIEHGELVVTDRATKRTLARTRLADLRNVTLDTKSIRKVEPGRDVVPAVQFIASQLGPEIDVARITLEVAGRPSVRLTDAFFAHTHAVEWIAKIRLFLRSHGWVPDDERPPQ